MLLCDPTITKDIANSNIKTIINILENCFKK